MSTISKFAGATLALGLMQAGCTTKSDVKEEWKEASEERREAEKTTEKYAKEKKKDYEKKVEKRLAEIDNKTAALRVDAVKASGDNKRRLEDGLWDLERRITEARDDLNSLKGKSANSYDDDQVALDEKLAAIEESIENHRHLAH